MKLKFSLLVILFIAYFLDAKSQIDIFNQEITVYVIDTNGISFYNDCYFINSNNKDTIIKPDGIIAYGKKLVLRRNPEYGNCLEIVNNPEYGKFTTVIDSDGFATLPPPMNKEKNLEEYINNNFKKTSKEINGITIYNGGINIRKVDRSTIYSFPENELNELLNILQLLPEYKEFKPYLKPDFPESVESDTFCINHIKSIGVNNEESIGLTLIKTEDLNGYIRVQYMQIIKTYSTVEICISNHYY